MSTPVIITVTVALLVASAFFVMVEFAAKSLSVVSIPRQVHHRMPR